MTNRVGQQIGNYQLVQLLGTGGFAEVYLGKHLHLPDRQAAIKVLQSLDQVHQQKFLEEARTVAGLNHQYIVQIQDFGIDDHIPYLVMQYAPEGTLRDRHPIGSVLSLDNIVYSYVKQIAEALQYAHDRDIIHRDVKPENVLLSATDQLLLSDFGIATIAQQTALMKTGHYAGTFSYSAPEQLQGKPRKESDQYALGIMVYEWLCGSVPFQGSLAEVVFKHIQEMAQPFGQGVAPMPGVEAVVMKALAKNPKDRYGSVWEFYQALLVAVDEYMWSPQKGITEAKTVYPTQQYPTLVDWSKIGALLKKAKELLDGWGTQAEALAAVDEAIRLNPGWFNVEANVLKGAVLFCLSRHEEALAVLDEVIRVDPRNAEAYDWKGRSLASLKRYEEALAAYNQAISLGLKTSWGYSWIEPDNARTHLMKGGVLQELGRYEEALVAFDQAISLRPNDSYAHESKGNTLYHLKRYEEALAAYNQRIRLGPKNPTAYLKKGETLQQLGKYEEALATFDQVISLSPRYVNPYRSKWDVLTILGRHEEATHTIELAVRNGISISSLFP